MARLQQSLRQPHLSDRFTPDARNRTGAASGMGRATAHLLADEGAVVGVVDRDADGLARVADEISDAGGRVHAVTADVGDSDVPAASYITGAVLVADGGLTVRNA
ncbi:SDR family NAD(P)-dependent oxidoreductase [Mycolicibacterium sp. P9-64]|uniref:SDR family NAD(P)-dependent oxidoreductase n=1 Tax=Mycolicibacterium sp. P9-64 TaxID=2024612 RepID=UPI0011ECF5BB|nr:SDR family NAD(P)-dependent oxidoreductase [Mycolicibacterium sp. P9-64]KAA0082477.1 SDR family NAD(P)-dependent oxidoreductase [Mycolicibacterium sp. P9-64]